MKRLLRLKPLQSRRTRELSRWLAPHAHDNAFNPSALEHGGKWYVGFRHFGATRRPPFAASLVVGPAGASPATTVDLTRHAAAFGVPVVADPKLVQLRGDVWLTFNDGWSATKNHLYLMRVTPELGRPVSCRFDQRRPIEKNWAFFDAGDELGVLYSVSPLRLLHAPWPRSDDDSISFTATNRGSRVDERLDLTLGTQLAEYGGRHYLVAHERWTLWKRRAYLGRWVCLSNLSEQPRVEVSPTRLLASYRSLAGSFTPHNKHLLSCTYFSGLFIDGGMAVLSYGINDVRAGFSEVSIDAL